jgi:hypothetical protein
VVAGDLLAVLSAGAYCMSMASNYNTRGRAAEVLVSGASARLIRRRETMEDQLRAEIRLTRRHPRTCSDQVRSGFSPPRAVPGAPTAPTARDFALRLLAKFHARHASSTPMIAA